MLFVAIVLRWRITQAKLSVSINMQGNCDARNEALAHLYCIDVTDITTGKTVQVFHRYTDFEVLRKDLGKNAGIEEKPFPSKLRLPCFSTQCEEERSAKRRAQLWEWLEQIVRESETNEAMTKLVADFLHPDSTQHKSKKEKAQEWLTNATEAIVGAVKSALAPSVTTEALVVIDVQHCFTNGETREGKRVKSKRSKGDRGLQSDRGDNAWKASVVDYVALWMSRKQPIVLLQDFHPDKHVSFITGGPGEKTWDPTNNTKSRTMGKSDFLHSNSEQGAKKEANFQKMTYFAPVFPSHCVKGTEEAKLIDGLCEAVGGVYDEDNACKVDSDKYPNVKVVQKGTNQNIDSFGGIYDNRMGYITELQGFASKELAERSSWGVLEWLNSNGVKSVETIGIADDYCVKTTALDLANKRKAEMANAVAIPKVVINPQYTYGIVAHLWEKDDVGYGIPKLYENLIGELLESELEGNGEVEVKRKPATEEL